MPKPKGGLMTLPKRGTGASALSAQEEIQRYLRRHARGRRRAIRRSVVLEHMYRQGYLITDRWFRKLYARCPQIGFEVAGRRPGLFWISTHADMAYVKSAERRLGLTALRRGSQKERHFANRNQQSLPV